MNKDKDDELCDSFWNSEIANNKPDGKAIERAVMADINRPCLYNVAGPCSHPKCLESHYQTLKQVLRGEVC